MNREVAHSNREVGFLHREVAYLNRYGAFGDREVAFCNRYGALSYREVAFCDRAAGHLHRKAPTPYPPRHPPKPPLHRRQASKGEAGAFFGEKLQVVGGADCTSYEWRRSATDHRPDVVETMLSRGRGGSAPGCQFTTRKFHAGFIVAIRASFFFRDQPLSCFSRAMACCTYWNRSQYSRL